jgi:hypothetical protein
MTLRDKLKEFAMDNHYKTYAELNAKKLEKIADDYAVEFAEWFRDFQWKGIEYTTEQLLEIFKKEKGL